MSHVAVGSRYAQAFLDCAKSPAEADALARVVEDLAKAFGESAELRAVLSSPVVPLAQREAVVSGLIDRLGGSDLARRSLLVMVRRGRIAALKETARSLRDSADEAQGILRGEVVTARPMAEPFYTDLERALSARHGRKVVLSRSVDPSLVAGVVTRVGGQTTDQSVRGHLQRMELDLLASVGKHAAASRSA